jgi:hypothetical protein
VITIAMRSFENLAQFRFFGKTVKNQNMIREEFTSGLNLDNACFIPVQNFYTSQTQSQNQSHITTDGQSVNMSWCRAQSGNFDQRIFFSKLLSCLFGAPSLTRGRVCHLLVLVIEVYLLFTTDIYIKLKLYIV